MKYLSPRRDAVCPRPLSVRSLVLASVPLLTLSAAPAAERTYQYLRFEPVSLLNFGTGMQLSEFTFSLGGNVLNVNNRDGSGTGVIPVAVTAGAQDPNANEGPMKVVDGLPAVNGGTPTSKWFTGAPFTTPLDFDFGSGTPLTFDSYNFATANDSANYGNRTPITWKLSGSHDKITWDLIDTRADVAVNNANNTYQGGFAVPDAASPLVTAFNYLDQSPTSAVVLNGGSFTLDWTTEFSDPDGVTLAPLTGSQALNGSLTVNPPDNALTPYVLTAARAVPALARSRTINVRTVAGGASTWQYVRYTITRRRPGTAGAVQLSEFEFLNAGSKVTVASASNLGGGNAADAGEGVNKLVDGLNNTKWLDSANQPVIFDFGSAVPFDSYQFVTGNDAPDRDPVSWTLEGSNDLGEWTLVDRVDYIYPTPAARSFSSRSIPLPGSSLAPTVPVFTGDAPVLIAGQPFRLTWQTTAAATVSISPSVGTVPTSGSVAVNPSETTTYTLTATSPYGLPVTATYQVTVIPQPQTETIAYGDFSAAGDELTLLRNAAVSNNRLRVVPELQNQSGEVWFRKRQNVAQGFETTFGLSMNQTAPNPSFLAADGMAFVIQNHAAGSGAQSAVGENGLTENALNIKFDTFGTVDDASALEIRSGNTVLHRVVLFKEVGVDLHGLFPGTPTFNYTTATNAQSPPYQVRIVYVPGSLDIYLDGIAVVQNFALDLELIGAVDADGTAYAGFTSRTGGNIQNSDITHWHLRSGDFSALPPFGLVKAKLVQASPELPPTELIMVWDSSSDKNYDIRMSEDLVNWTTLIDGQQGTDGQSKVQWMLYDQPERAYYRVEEKQP